ncbi:hypothetical protein J6P52_05815 [bacterium]|nr:hypothetical protein [bacterium]
MFDKLTKNKNIHVMLLRNYLNNSSFKYEYIDKQPCIKKRVHYPDFIIEKNNNIYVCEIKSDNDYDAIKTEELKKAYKEYSTLNDYHYLILSYITKNNFR